MLWLFGQIWLWLLVSFLLGAAVMWLLTRMARPRAEGAGATEAARPEPSRPPAEPPAPTDAEQTHYLPPVEESPHDDFGYHDSGYHEEDPGRVYNDYPEIDPDEPYPPRDAVGYPEPEPRLSGELDWPADEEYADDWPHEDEPAQRRPGRSG
ncbi:LapA family protein [Amycolatopsis jiangsuensis]|uniref:LapA family protein n=1 Tax=Amycolatopsis jiangsuensis TaxID=1181879 RepID=A0A840J374_9PSEU|nr:LapA family protein [Amycolatopsis jiangsuensis]MBB4687907.1 hypothetical protein [Amycolatopsis jiangsuensis]